MPLLWRMWRENRKTLLLEQNCQSFYLILAQILNRLSEEIFNYYHQYLKSRPTYFGEVPKCWTSLTLDTLPEPQVASIVQHVVSSSTKRNTIKICLVKQPDSSEKERKLILETFCSTVHLWYSQDHKEQLMLNPAKHVVRYKSMLQTQKPLTEDIHKQTFLIRIGCRAICPTPEPPRSILPK